MNPLTVAQFRSDFSEFADVDAYPDALLQMWVTLATTIVANSTRWGSLLTMGQELCAAHYVVIAARDLANAALGQTPGAVVGVPTSKAVGDVSASYDTASISFADAPFWNQTTYGKRFYQLVRYIGAGGLQL